MLRADLIKSCIAQNRKAQKELYEVLFPYLRAVAKRYLRDTSYVKDVLQEGFVKIFKNIDKFDSKKAPFKSWATRIVINSCFNYNDRIIGVPSDEFSITQHETAVFPSILEHLSNEDLLSILKRMPEGYFEVFNLYVIDQYKHDEIAEMLGITPSLSRKRLSRARNWTKKFFQKKPDLMADLSALSFIQN